MVHEIQQRGDRLIEELNAMEACLPGGLDGVLAGEATERCRNSDHDMGVCDIEIRIVFANRLLHL